MELPPKRDRLLLGSLKGLPQCGRSLAVPDELDEVGNPPFFVSQSFSSDPDLLGEVHKELYDLRLDSSQDVLNVLRSQALLQSRQEAPFGKPPWDEQPVGAGTPRRTES